MSISPGGFSDGQKLIPYLYHPLLENDLEFIRKKVSRTSTIEDYQESFSLCPYLRKFNDSDRAASAALIKAAECGNLVMIRYLFDQKGAPLFARPDSKGRTPLIRAVMKDQCEAARLLIDLGEEVNSRYFFINSAGKIVNHCHFWWAAEINKNPEMVSLLLEKRARKYSTLSPAAKRLVSEACLDLKRMEKIAQLKEQLLLGSLSWKRACSHSHMDSNSC